LRFFGVFEGVLKKQFSRVPAELEGEIEKTLEEAYLKNG
jgi:hypothetical protein